MAFSEQERAKELAAFRASLGSAVVAVAAYMTLNHGERSASPDSLKCSSSISALAFAVLKVVVGAPQQWTIIDSCYWSITTITTVGYGDLTPGEWEVCVWSGLWHTLLFLVPTMTHTNPITRYVLSKMVHALLRSNRRCYCWRLCPPVSAVHHASQGEGVPRADPRSGEGSDGSQEGDQSLSCQLRSGKHFPAISCLVMVSAPSVAMRTVGFGLDKMIP